MFYLERLTFPISRISFKLSTRLRRRIELLHYVAQSRHGMQRIAATGQRSPSLIKSRLTATANSSHSTLS
jgi:hypothetical protein